jgi:ArsR family transcriptional regulator, arsenate/arsenite/antimonite-responsive transcriptional repressor
LTIWIPKMTELVHALKTLADETRLSLVKLLLTHDLCVGALARRLAVSEAAVSQHLGKLREAGLVKGEKRGYWTHYTVDKEKVRKLAGLLRDLTALPSCPEGVCIKKQDNKIDCYKEDAKMCDCKCQHPEKLKGKPEECTPVQIKECHGEVKVHPCRGDEKKKK